MAKRPITIQLEPDLIEAIDVARRGLPRQAWIARAAEQALDDPGPSGDGAVSGSVTGAPRSPAPAEQPSCVLTVDEVANLGPPKQESRAEAFRRAARK